MRTTDHALSHAVLLIALAGSLAAPRPALGQTDQPEPDAPTEDAPLEEASDRRADAFVMEPAESDAEADRHRRVPPFFAFTVNPGFKHFAEAEAEGRDASVSNTRYGGSFAVTRVHSDDLTFTLRFAAFYADYDFENGGRLIQGAPAAADPFSDVQEYTINPILRYDINDKITVFGGAILQYSGELGAEFDDATTAGGLGGVDWQISDNFKLTLGLLVSSQINEDEVSVFPAIGVDWSITDRLRLANRGRRIALTYDVKEWLAVGLEGSYERRVYRFDDDNPVLPGGGVTDDAFTVGGTVIWKPNRGMQLTATVGAAVYRELEFFDNREVDVGSTEFDPDLFVSANFRMRF